MRPYNFIYSNKQKVLNDKRFNKKQYLLIYNVCLLLDLSWEASSGNDLWYFEYMYNDKKIAKQAFLHVNKIYKYVEDLVNNFEFEKALKILKTDKYLIDIQHTSLKAYSEDKKYYKNYLKSIEEKAYDLYYGYINNIKLY